MICKWLKHFIDQIAKAYREYKETQAKRNRILNISHPPKHLASNDLAYFGASSCCPLCSLYNGRIFSISGKDSRFPPIITLPNEIHDGKCDVCNRSYNLLPWFEGTSTPDVNTAIRQSNAPLVDKRTPEQKASFEKDQEKIRRKYYKKVKEV